MGRSEGRLRSWLPAALVAPWILLGTCALAQVPLGDPFQVNTVGRGYQEEPSVSLGLDGQVFVAWLDVDIPFSASWVDYKQLDAAERVLHEGHVNEILDASSGPRMCSDEQGESLVAWNRAFRRMGAEGLPASTEISIERTDLEIPVGVPDVSGLAGQSFAIVYTGYRNVAPLPESVDAYARLVGAAGELLTGPFRVNERVEGDQGNPRVAAAEDGSFVVAWIDSSGADGEGLGVGARRFDRTGRALGPDIVVNERHAGDQVLNDIEMDAAGNWVAVWVDIEAGANGPEIVYRRFDAGGHPLTGDLKANQHTSGWQAEPSIAMDRRGNFVIAWHDALLESGEYSETIARLFRPDGTPVGGEFRVSEGAPESEDELPSVALSRDGSFFVAWQGWREEIAVNEVYDVEGRRFFRGCRPGASRLTLHDGRFEVCASYRTPAGAEGVGEPLALTGESGAFWFFEPSNLEVVLKLLDGCGTNGNFWVFSAGLTNLEITLGVLDTWSGRTWIFDNDQGTPYPPIGEITSLPVCDAIPRALPDASAPLVRAPRSAARQIPRAPVSEATGAAVTCSEDATHLCLQDARFRVSARFRTPAGEEGDARVVPLGEDSGALWFFWPENLELFVKVLDACTLPGFENFWVFAAGLTDLEIDLTVVDTLTNAEKTYRNPQHRLFPAVLDSSAFATCE